MISGKDYTGKSGVIARQPEAMRLRYLQTLSDIATGTTNAKLVLPIPLDLFRMLLKQTEQGKSGG